MFNSNNNKNDKDLYKLCEAKDGKGLFRSVFDETGFNSLSRFINKALIIEILLYLAGAAVMICIKELFWHFEPARIIFACTYLIMLLALIAIFLASLGFLIIYAAFLIINFADNIIGIIKGIEKQIKIYIAEWLTVFLIIAANTISIVVVDFLVARYDLFIHV